MDRLLIKITSLGYFLSLYFTINTYAQVSELTIANATGNKKALVKETIGLTDVTITYNRPGVKGREGKIWGTPIVHKGFIKPLIGTSTGAPWRAGADENTTIFFSTAVKIEGKDLPAGTYGFFIAYDDKECICIFSKRSTSWGHFYYDEKEDALRVVVKPVKMNESVEWLKYEFINQTYNSATVALMWEKLMISFTVEADIVKTQIESFRKELTNGQVILRWQPWNQAATFCIDNKTNIDEALIWVDQAIFYSGPNFSTYATKSRILTVLGKNQEADSLMKAALSSGSIQELHTYARGLIKDGQKVEALEVFKLNHSRNPDNFITLTGMARGYSATGDFKTALKYAKQALLKAPSDINKTNAENLIKKLEEGNDIN